MTDPLTKDMPELVAKLPLGFTATFSWTGGQMHIGWDPHFPGFIRSPRKLRQLLEAYHCGRRGGRCGRDVHGNDAVEIRGIPPADKH
jgi:hypothetical protein